MSERYLVTPALPYANGPLHLGHLVEHVQVNIYVRALRMAKKEVLYICGADSHGTPIEMNAAKAGMNPQDFAKMWQERFASTLGKFAIEFDGGFGTTHTESNELHAQKIFQSLNAKGHIHKKSVEQFFDPKAERFLPDRLVRGTCPHCKAVDQYGDACEVCGHTYQPTELINPKSALTGETPIFKSSEHYFVRLSQFEDALRAWTGQQDTLHEDTRAFLKHWFIEGLKDWDISRDGPYFGFKIPGEDNKYFYVWLDAPIGYISISEMAAKERGETFDDYWLNPDTKICHFIGKDIVYFHTLFWPAMLMAAGYNLPYRVFVHGMLTIDGEKMSKSRGTFILADTFHKYFDAQALRYYFACKLGNRTEDIDLNLHDLVARVNSDLVNKVVNLVSRCLPLLHRVNGGHADELDCSMSDIVERSASLVDRVKNFYLGNEPSKAMGEIVRFAEEGNRYLQEQAPWKLAAVDPHHAARVLTTALYMGKVCLGLLKPVLPLAAEELENMINEGSEFDFATIANPFAVGMAFKPYNHIFKRIDEAQVTAMMKDATNDESKTAAPALAKLIDFEQFLDVELRAAKVTASSAVADSDKLISLTLDVGDLGTRHVFAGLRPHVTPEFLLGKTVVLVANLKPRKMRFGTSEGMILACGEETPEPIILNHARPGERVR